MDLKDLTLDIDQSIEIKAPIADVFEGLIHRFGEGNVTPEGVTMPMRLERQPGGRWFRDLGNETGHLWGFVQVIKPPTVLEIYGPMFMSYPVAGHIRISLKETAGITHLSLRHRALGLIEADHKKGVDQGWAHYLKSIKQDCE